MSDPYAPRPQRPPAELVPHRARQAPPADAVQAQLHLLVQSVQVLAGAVAELSAARRSGRSQAIPAEQAEALARQVGELGGWAESLLPTGVPLRDGEGWVVLD